MSAKNIINGRLSMHRDGYGFVIPESTTLRSKLDGDVFIPPGGIGQAMHGDRVEVELGGIRAGGRAEGRILRVAGRAHTTVVGTFHYGHRFNTVTPIDEKIHQDIVIPRGMEQPEKRNTKDTKEARREPVHRVLGEEAKRRPEVRDLEGVVVDVEITDWPTPTQSPRGRVIEILGSEDDFGVDVEIIIRKYHLPHRFPAETLEEAQAFSDIIPAAELERRRDYRAATIVTIDGETARDFDDAARTATTSCRCTSPTWATTSGRARRWTRRRGCAAPPSISPTAPCPCCRWNSRPTCAACARAPSAW